MAFTPQFLDELRARVSLVDIISRRVKLTKKGREHSGLCPFHNEKSPSFTVSEEKGFYHCFGCGAHGDIIGFEMQAGGLGFPDAVEKLAGEAGMDVPKSTPEEAARAKKQASLYEVVELACAFYEKQLRLPVGKAALAYLNGRGLDDGIISRFRLGYAPPGNVLRVALKRENITEEQMLDAGLIGQPDDGRSPFDYFRDRAIFPIKDRRGQPIAFGGRIMGEGNAKYLNSPESVMFHKGRVLYGLAQARPSAHKEGAVIVTEGYMDVIALHRAGFHNAVAPLGTALTEDQLRELWKLASEPTLCFDGDTAGQRAAFRGAERALPLLKPGQSLRFAMLPAGQDPDDLLNASGPSAMQTILDEAQPLHEAVWNMTLEGNRVDTPEHKAKFERDLMDRVYTIEDKTVQDHYVTLMRDRLWKTFKARKKTPWKKGSQGGGKWREEISGGASIAARITERSDANQRIDHLGLADLAGFLIRYPMVLEKHVDDVAAVYAQSGAMADIIGQAVELLSVDPDMPWTDILKALEDSIGGKIMAGVSARLFGYPEEDPPYPDLEAEFLRMLHPMQEQALVLELESVMAKMDEDESPELAERYKALHAELDRLRIQPE